MLNQLHSRSWLKMLSTPSIIAIIGGVIGAVIVISVLAFVGTTLHDNSHCNNWVAAINDKNAVMEQRLTEINNAQAEFNNAGFWDTLNFDTSGWKAKSDQYNLDRQVLLTEIDDYNRECVY